MVLWIFYFFFINSKNIQRSDTGVESKILEKRDFLKDLHPRQKKRTMESDEGKQRSHS